MITRWLALPVTVVMATALAACGTDGASDEPPPGLSASGLVGWDLIQNRGCVACHGLDGAGGTGPSWFGVAGSERRLDDGTTVVADRAYLTRAVVDPQADQLAGYTILMPQVPLNDSEVAAIVDMLEELG